MKSKLLVCCALILSAVVASAIPWSPDVHNGSNALIKAGKLTEARAYLDTVDAISQPRAIQYRLYADAVDSAVDTSTPAKLYALAEGYYRAVGRSGVALKNASEYAVLWVLAHGVNDYDAALAYYATLENPSVGCVGRAVFALNALGRSDEAVALAVANKDWYTAFGYSANKKDKLKTFEYGKALVLNSYQKAPIVLKVLDAIGGFNYADTAITEEQQVVFLKAVDLKYRRFLVTDKAAWEPIIAGIRLTLQGYGVEVK